MRDPADSLGLAPLKVEGVALPYDRDGLPGPPRRWWDVFRPVVRRLRWLPDRLWWAVFGGEYY